MITVVFGLEVTHPNLDGEVSGSNPGHTNDFNNGTCCFSTCAGHNELEKGECFSHKMVQIIPLYNGPPDKGGIFQRADCLIKVYKAYWLFPL